MKLDIGVYKMYLINFIIIKCIVFHLFNFLLYSYYVSCFHCLVYFDIVIYRMFIPMVIFLEVSMIKVLEKK